MRYSLATIFEQQVQEDISKAKHTLDINPSLKTLGLGTAIVVGTGGEMDNSMQEMYLKMFQNPEQFNYKNIEEENFSPNLNKND